MEHPAVLGWRRLLLAVERSQQARERHQEYAHRGENGHAGQAHDGLHMEGPRVQDGSESPVLRGRRGQPQGGPPVIPATLLQNSNIRDYLQAADHVAPESPLVARMLTEYAYNKAMEMDPDSEGRGVLQFKTSLHTLLWRQQRAEHRQPGVDAEDAAAFQEFCRAYHERLRTNLPREGEEVAVALTTARVLNEVLHSLGERDPTLVSGELRRDMAEDAAKTELLSRQCYNIIPLNVRDSGEPIMELAEVRDAIAALETTGHLPGQPGTRLPFPDMLDFLKFTFGFQTDSVHNQREHIVLLLANLMTRSHAPEVLERVEEAVKELFDIIMKNYRGWTEYLGITDMSIRVRDMWQNKLLFVALYLLIIGEAANVRFVPECLCYLFHKMAEEMSGMLRERDARRSVLVTADSKYEFLHNVILPLYLVIKEEAQYGGKGFDAKGHQEWRNYDDLNEFFWSSRCMDLGWPLDISHGFFTPPPGKASRQAVRAAHEHSLPATLWELRESQSASAAVARGERPAPPERRALRGGRRESKSLFAEWRTFWHVYHSFDRHWIFLFLMLQAMIIIAFSSPNKAHTIYKILTLAPTAACLIFMQAAVDVSLSLGAYRSMAWSMIWGKWLRLLVAAGWAASLVFFAIKMLGELTRGSQVWLGSNVVLVAVYLLPKLVLNLLRRISPLRRRVDKFSTWRLSRFLRWLYQEQYFVGRGMFESTGTSFLYSSFWVILFICKFLFSYYFMVQPLVAPTRYLADFAHLEYKWHDLFSSKHWNFLTLASIWSPVVIIYLLDTQIWYTVLSALGSGAIGAYWHLGEIRTLSMVRGRFRSFPQEFVRKLQPISKFDRTYSESANSGDGLPEIMERRNTDRFGIVWNEIIKSMREEDLLSNKERDLLVLPQIDGATLVHWPLFLLANKLMLALGTAEAHNEDDDVALWKRVCEDYYMRCAVTELYGSLWALLLEVTAGDDPAVNTDESRVVNGFFGEIESAVLQGNFVRLFVLKNLRTLHTTLAALTAVLIKAQSDELTSKAVGLLQTLYEVAMRDFIHEDIRAKLEGSPLMRDPRVRSTLFSRITWPTIDRARRLHQLLTIADSAKGVPRNLEARRRLQFFTNSLFMAMPEAPPVRKMVPFCVLTPYYSEIVKYSKDELTKLNEDGISTLYYLQKIFPDEWENLLERIGVKHSHVEASMDADKEGTAVQEVRKWASYRGQTLARTVRGMMYYRRALRLLAYMESGRGRDLEQGRHDGLREPEDAYMQESTRALADLKFIYVVTCQLYGAQKLANDARAADIFELMKANEGLRVAFIEEVDVIRGQGASRTKAKEFFSRLVRVDAFGQEQSIYKVKLPGAAIQGEGKPENQNHAIIFTRGEALQTIDMNQDNYLEEAMKMRNLLQEFRRRHGLRRPTILGVREHVFTGSVSSLAWFMSNQETSFVTLGQRFMASPLKVRMHYGHPDVFDRLFHMTRGGISKASKSINISEDIFAGFNTTLRQGNVTHHEYIQVGKGRDVGLNQIAIFEAKVAGGNGEQVLSRDVYRLGQLFDFHRMMSFFYTSVGFYICTMLTVWCVYFFLYGRVYMALSGVEETLHARTDALGDKALTAALNAQFLLQIGVFTAVPMVMGFILEQGLLQAMLSFITLQLQMASVFFTFSLGTRTHYFGRTILHGGAKYRNTGRGFVVRHEKFAENYRLFSRSHFVKGLEVVMLLVVYLVYGSHSASSSYLLLSFSSWFMAVSWCFAPFIFNPSGFEWQKTVQDFEDWTNWLFYSGGIDKKGEQSWEAWWEEELSHIRTVRGRFLEVVLSLRFFLFQYGIAYRLHVDKGSTSLLIYAYSWAAIGGILILFWVSNLGRTWDVQLAVRLVQGSLFLGALVFLILLVAFTALTISDIFACILAIIPTGWGLLQIAIALKPLFKLLGWWKRIRAFARLYDAGMGALIFFPVALLSWFPFVSTFQTRLLFNQAFSRGLEISLIVGGNKGDKDD